MSDLGDLVDKTRQAKNYVVLSGTDESYAFVIKSDCDNFPHCAAHLFYAFMELMYDQYDVEEPEKLLRTLLQEYVLHHPERFIDTGEGK